MPYLIITDREHELDRHELKGPAVVGRSPDCDVVVRDVLLSRHHCRIEQYGKNWMVVDLGSKNGTYIEGQKIERQLLNDADVIRAGRTRIIFRAGRFVPPPPEVIERRASRRPADPIEALSGTMVGFVLTDMEENSRVTGFPIPQPKPAETSARRRESIEHDQKKPPAMVARPEWDLALRDIPAHPLRAETPAKPIVPVPPPARAPSVGASSAPGSPPPTDPPMTEVKVDEVLELPPPPPVEPSAVPPLEPLMEPAPPAEMSIEPVSVEPIEWTVEVPPEEHYHVSIEPPPEQQIEWTVSLPEEEVTEWMPDQPVEPIPPLSLAAPEGGDVAAPVAPADDAAAELRGETTALSPQTSIISVPAPPPAPPPDVPRRPARDAEPQPFATAPRWMALLYVLVVYCLCALAFWLVVWA